MKRQSTEDLLVPEWQQTQLLPAANVTLFLRVELDGPTATASVSLTGYSGAELDALEALACAYTTFECALDVSIGILEYELKRTFGYISPF